MRVLLAGLGEMLRQFVRDVLARCGDVGVEAGSPAELAAVGSETVDVVLVAHDHDDDTRAWCDAVRSTAGCRDAAIVALLANVDEANAARLLDTGIDDIFFTSLGATALELRLAISERAATNRARRREIQEQLITADRMASVGTLAAGVAHEVNNPLSFVTSNLQMIERALSSLAARTPDLPVTEILAMVADAQAGAERVTKIVRGLETFARTEAERATVIDVSEPLELAINLALNEIRHRARLVKQYGAPCLVFADAARLGQVFLNLLMNAAQAIPEGNTESNEIRIVTQSDLSGNVVIEIHDTGRGIPQDILGRIFEPFFTTKAVGQGTGLGLSICHNIVKGMRGTLTAASSEHGSSFRIVLPRADQPAPAAPVAEEVAPVTASTRASVLVVDDEPLIGVMITRVLHDHDVTVVHRALDALTALAQGQRFDVIFSDVMMPQMSGMDLYRELTRAYPQQAERVVFMTGGAFTPTATAFLDSVPNERLQKPFSVDAVMEVITKIVK